MFVVNAILFAVASASSLGELTVRMPVGADAVAHRRALQQQFRRLQTSFSEFKQQCGNKQQLITAMDQMISSSADLTKLGLSGEGVVNCLCSMSDENLQIMSTMDSASAAEQQRAMDAMCGAECREFMEFTYYIAGGIIIAFSPNGAAFTDAQYKNFVTDMTSCMCVDPQLISQMSSLSTSSTGSQAQSVFSGLCAYPSCGGFISDLTTLGTLPSGSTCPPAPPQPPPQSEDEPCFASSATVTLSDGSPSRMDAIKEGDALLVATADGALSMDTVSILSVAQPDKSATFYTLTTAEGDALTLTPAHHLPVGAVCCSSLKMAKDVQLHETIWAVSGGGLAPRTVSEKTLTVAQGLHSPVMTHGTFPLVDGFVTSFDSIGKVTLASYGLPTLLNLCKLTGTCSLLRSLMSQEPAPDAAPDATGGQPMSSLAASLAVAALAASLAVRAVSK